MEAEAKSLKLIHLLLPFGNASGDEAHARIKPRSHAYGRAIAYLDNNPATTVFSSPGPDVALLPAHIAYEEHRFSDAVETAEKAALSSGHWREVIFYWSNKIPVEKHMVTQAWAYSWSLSGALETRQKLE